MGKISRIHEKILDHLLMLREKDSEFYFVPRKINNKKRLDKGYWFLGNENYLNLSFWNGEDWKEKIHNIGFVVQDNKSTYIELSAQDSKIKADFLSRIANELGGFEKEPNKDKWYKYYMGKNFIESLNDFIINSKPIIDRHINLVKPKGITLLDNLFFDKYGKKILKGRKEQIEFGDKNKLSKICWNTRNWKFPSGSPGKSISIGSYEAKSGFGHEEWLFDKSRIIEGYHYAFLQPLNLKTNKHHNKTYNISLFTINNLNKKYFVGEIKHVECINTDESARIYQEYKSKGWIKSMEKDLERVVAKYTKLTNTSPENFFNIRFTFKNVYQSEELIEIADNDVNITTNRYKLLPRKSDISLVDQKEDEYEGNKKNTDKRKKVFNSECEYDPYHDQMQNAIFELLKSSEYDYKKVCIEKGRVDIKGKTQSDTWHYFELKTDNAKQSIRKALGQILEYAYFPETNKAEKLIIVADEEPNENVIKYLNYIRDRFKLPISYRFFNIETNKLSGDY